MPLQVKGEADLKLQALPLGPTMLRPSGIQPTHGTRPTQRALRLLRAAGALLMGIGVALALPLMTTTARLGRTVLAVAKKSLHFYVAEKLKSTDWANPCRDNPGFRGQPPK